MNPPYLPAVLFAGAALAVFVLISGLTAVYRLVRPAARRAPDDGRALARAVVAARPPRDWEGQLDRSFDRMVRWTLLGITPQQAVGVLLLGAAVGGSALFLLTGDLPAAGFGLLLGAAIPLTMLLFLQRRWRRAVQEQLPDGLFLLARSLRAGLSLEQAFVAVRPYCPKPLVEVFGRCADQIELGLAAPEALQRLADSVDLADLRALASVAALNRDVGGRLSVMVDRLAAGVRDRNQFRNFLQSATALGRTTATFIALATPAIALFLYFDQPDLFMNFFRSGLGLAVFAASIGLEVVGVIWLALLLRGIDY